METMRDLQNHLQGRPLELQKLRNQGVKIIGYMPEELVYAVGAIPVGLLQRGHPKAEMPP